VDGTVLAQLGVTDMRLPIQYALSHPERWDAAIPGMDWAKAMHLDFDRPDRERFPCLALAYEALEKGGSVPATLNAANEEAVSAFLEGRVPFTAIPDTIREVIDARPAAAIATLEHVLEADAQARRTGREALARRARVTLRAH